MRHPRHFIVPIIREQLLRRTPAAVFGTARHFAQSTTNISSANIIKRVCIVGAGPAGFYAAQCVVKHLPDAEVDIVEKLPVPFGLVR